MRKKIIIILSIWIILSIIFGIWYKKNGPKHPKIDVKPISSGAKAAKEPFKTIGMASTETTLKYNKPILVPFAKQMRELGAENIKLNIETSKNTMSETLPTVIIGGKKYKNKTICAIVSYDYKGDKYEVGTCK